MQWRLTNDGNSFNNAHTCEGFVVAVHGTSSVGSWLPHYSYSNTCFIGSESLFFPRHCLRVVKGKFDWSSAFWLIPFKWTRQQSYREGSNAIEGKWRPQGHRRADRWTTERADWLTWLRLTPRDGEIQLTLVRSDDGDIWEISIIGNGRKQQQSTRPRPLNAPTDSVTLMNFFSPKTICSAGCKA